MNKTKRGYKIRRYFRRTFKNKLLALFMLICGVAVWAIGSDATALVFLAMIAVPLFVTKEDWTY